MVYAHSIHNPDGVRFVGPLAPLAGELKGEFARLGYATSSATAQLQLAAHLSRWLQAEELGTQDLTGPVIERFLAARRRDYSNHYSLQALDAVAGVLAAGRVRARTRCARTLFGCRAAAGPVR